MCEGIDPDGDRDAYECTQRLLDSHTAYLITTWTTYVERGNTPLLELPFWVAEVGHCMAEARVDARAHRLIEDEKVTKAGERLGIAIQTYNAGLTRERERHVN